MSEKVILQLGDIIQLHAPTNMNYHDKRFFVESRDNKKITLILLWGWVSDFSIYSNFKKMIYFLFATTSEKTFKTLYSFFES
jgi:hypothetical protein